MKPIIGLAGGIGSGKSTVAGMMAEAGAAVISSDALNRTELESPEVRATLTGWWGDGILAPDGRVDRQALRRRISADPNERARLEALMHPRIARLRQELMTRFLKDTDVKAVVLDSPLLFEAGLDEQCDAVVLVESDRAVRLERVRQSRGWTGEDLDRLEASQKGLDFKRDRADYRVVNNSDPDDLRRQVRGVFSQILSGSPGVGSDSRLTH